MRDVSVSNTDDLVFDYYINPYVCGEVNDSAARTAPHWRLVFIDLRLLADMIIKRETNNKHKKLLLMFVRVILIIE